jgi:drug/metabolite transporter (DMT)-like permease
LSARPLPLVVAGATCIAFSGILVRLADVTPSTAAFYRCAYAVPPLAALALWERRRYGSRGTRARTLAWIAGGFFAADLVLWHHSIAAVGAGLATVLGNVQVVLVPIAAWLVLRERPATTVAAAVPVVLVGVVLISGVVGSGAYGEDPALGALFGILTAVAYAGFLLTLRAGSADARRSAGALSHATLAAALFTLPIGWALGELDLEPTWPAHGWLVVLALTSQVLGWLLIAAALPRAPAAVSSVVLTLQPVMSVVLAMLLVDEQPSPWQLAGIAVVVCGIALATLGPRGTRPSRTREIGTASGRVHADSDGSRKPGCSAGDRRR